MLHFSQLSQLQTHTTFLSDTLGTNNFFIVGGSIRDLLLGITSDPTDIDLAVAGDPDTLWELMQIDETTTARFRTEKFGTATIIKKGTPPTSYEITPFREESGYADNRHPEQIVRSDDLIADSQRRDFTINALYRTTYILPIEPAKKIEPLKDDTHLLTILKKHGGCFLVDTRTIILQSHDLIKDYLADKLDLQILPCLHTDEKSLQTTSKPLQTSVLLDPQHGLNDLIGRKLRAVGDPVQRYTEDALRILRGVRFVNILNQKLPNTYQQNSGFDFEKKTRQGMGHTASLVESLSKERLHQELMKVFEGNNPFGYVALIRELGLLSGLFPALAGTIDNRQPVRYHPFDTYNHTILTLRHLQKLLSETPAHLLIDDVGGALVKCAMLYHDVGKPEQYAFMDAALQANPENPDRTGYVAHPEISVRLAKEDFTKLSCSAKEIETICRYIQRHHRPGEILDSNEDSRPKKLRELISDGGYEHTMNLLTIAIADRLGQYNPLQTAAIAEIEELKLMATALYEKEGRFTMKQLAISGTDLMEEFALAAGPQIGELLKKSFDRVMEEVETRNTKKQILTHLKSLKIVTNE